MSTIALLGAVVLTAVICLAYRDQILRLCGARIDTRTDIVESTINDQVTVLELIKQTGTNGLDRSAIEARVGNETHADQIIESLRGLGKIAVALVGNVGLRYFTVGNQPLKPAMYSNSPDAHRTLTTDDYTVLELIKQTGTDGVEIAAIRALFGNADQIVAKLQGLGFLETRTDTGSARFILRLYAESLTNQS